VDLPATFTTLEDDLPSTQDWMEVADPDALRAGEFCLLESGGWCRYPELIYIHSVNAGSISIERGLGLTNRASFPAGSTVSILGPFVGDLTLDDLQ
jgi:hypothetical protein